MRSLGDPAFFRVFDAMVADARPQSATRRPTWSHAGIDWAFERLSRQGVDVSFAIETYILRGGARTSWRMIVAREYWWAGDEALRESRWAKMLDGPRVDAMEWLRAQERQMRAAGKL